ncbi:MAG: hypothetical protein IEMM0006_0651 [bacterium]|nr:MAG: hypothetical protein IEMM0006_0651 [bacterium]
MPGGVRAEVFVNPAQGGDFFKISIHLLIGNHCKPVRNILIRWLFCEIKKATE